HTRSKRDWSSDVCSSDLSDGDEIDIEAADGCENAHEAFEGYQDLSNEVSASASVQGVLEFWVSDLPQTLTYSPVDEPNIFVWSEIGRASCRERVWVTEDV